MPPVNTTEGISVVAWAAENMVFSVVWVGGSLRRMKNPLGTPELAIEAFERIHGLNVTIHDLDGSLTPFLQPNRFYHRSPLCLAVKAQGHYNACSQFDVKHLRRELVGLPEGRVHICPAGLVEWVVPVFEQQLLRWVLFAGPRSAGVTLATMTCGSAILRSKPFSHKKNTLLSAVEETEAQLILEHLRQLTARLWKWVHEGNWRHKVSCSIPRQLDSGIMRNTVVRRIIEEEYAGPLTLLMVAKRLCLSESRTSHAVHKACGMSFREMLIQKRLEVAKELLRYSEICVLDIALASGFEDMSHFHRLFRRRIGMTPIQYRKFHGNQCSV